MTLNSVGIAFYPHRTLASMVYVMEIYTDGGCRVTNGQLGTIGAAAAASKRPNGTFYAWTQPLPRHPLPTNQRAELTGIITALQLALEWLNGRPINTYLWARIFSNSNYAVECMTTWTDLWTGNEWVDAEGNELANQDLLQEAWSLDERLRA